MALDFSSYLSTPVDSIEAPKPLPIGHYFATVKSWTSVEAKSEKKTPMIKVEFTLNQADADVDQTLLPEGGLNNRTVTANYTLNNELGLFQLKQLIEEACKIKASGLSLGDALPHIVGQQVKLQMDQRVVDGQTFPDVKKALAIDAA